MTRIFISHSHSDKAIAYKLVTFLLAALKLEDEEITCTSDPDQGLSYSSSSITDQLKNQLKNSGALIVLITADSLHSAWIPFEAGTFWTTDKPIIPILGPGLNQNDLPGPLKSFLSIPIEVQDAEDKLNDATNQLAHKLDIRQKVTTRRRETLKDFSDALRAWQSQRSAPDRSQQKEIEELKAQIQELELHIEDKERSHKEQLEEVQALSKQEQEELERNYQNQKQELEQNIQSLQSQIRQLEQQLESERSQNQQLEEKERSLQAKIEQLEQELSEARSQLGQLKERSQTASQAQSFTEDLGKGITLDMIAIPGGTFMMGSLEGEGEDREKPQHEVTVQAFWMGKYPITQAQYQEVMGKNPSHFKGDERPVECVSWDDAVEFCQRLSRQTGKEYRLSTEAEWEYACRAGTTTEYYFGDDITSDLANYGRNVGETTSVGQYSPNVFGLYDMHGNVWEWCQDNWDKNYEGAPNDGSAWFSESSSIKVRCGGSWNSSPNLSRSAYRYDDTRDLRTGYIGVRVVCVAPSTT